MTMRASFALLFAVILVGRNEAASLGGEIGPSTRYIPGRALARLLHEAQINSERCGEHMLCLPISQFESDHKLFDSPEVLATTAGTSFNERPSKRVEGASDLQSTAPNSKILPSFTTNDPSIGENFGYDISKTTLNGKPKSTTKKTDDLIVNDFGLNAVKESSPGTNNGGSSSLSSSLGSKLSRRPEADIGHIDLPKLREFNRWLAENLKKLEGKSRNDDISSSKGTYTLANSSHYSEGSLPVDSTGVGHTDLPKLRDFNRWLAENLKSLEGKSRNDGISSSKGTPTLANSSHYSDGSLPVDSSGVGHTDLPKLRDFNRWLAENLKKLEGKSRNDGISSSKGTPTLANSSHYSDGSLPVDSTGLSHSDLAKLRDFDFNRWLAENLKSLEGESRNDDISPSKDTSTLANSSHYSDGSLPVDSTGVKSSEVYANAAKVKNLSKKTSTDPLVQSSSITPGEPDSTVKKPKIQGAGGSITGKDSTAPILSTKGSQSLPISNTGDFTEDNVPSKGAKLHRTETTQQLSSKRTKDTQSPHAKAAKESNVDTNLPATYLVESDSRYIASNNHDDKDSTVKASAASSDSSEILPVTVGESSVKESNHSTPESHSQTANVKLTDTTPIFKVATPTLYSSTSSEDIPHSAQSTPLLPSSAVKNPTSVLFKKQQSINPTNVLSTADVITSVPVQSLALSSNKIGSAGKEDKSNEDKTVGELQRIAQKTTKSTQTPTISVPSISYSTGNDYLIQFVPIIHTKDTRQSLFCPPISPNYVYTLNGNNTINNHQPITHCQ